MSDDMALDTPFLEDEGKSIAAPSIARESAYFNGRTTGLKNNTAMIGGGLPVLSGAAVALWATPALLLARFRLSELFAALANTPIRASVSDLLLLLFVMVYLVATGLLLGFTAERSALLSRWRRAAARIVLVPMIVLSLSATVVVSVPLFLGLIVQYFPSLL